MKYIPPTHEQREGFHNGTSRIAYKFLGAHPSISDGKPVWHFAVWAPNAKRVSVIGEFCYWDYDAYQMEKQYDGIWEIEIPKEYFDMAHDHNNESGLCYKYAILGADDTWQLKFDPYAFQGELRPKTASKLYDLDGYEWNDSKWMQKRSRWNPYKSPVNIYELHLGSWKRDWNGQMLSYTEIADQLIPYIQECGYTHVEFLPVMEHPLDISWGYQVTGYYAPTARYGDPFGLMELIDRLHQANIGVILDWVPAHFPKDEMGLRRFDGANCYEHADWRRSEMKQWGTLLFDYGRGEVCSFLLSNACYWLEYYHVDGLRCDAVSAMIYHDFCRSDGEWLPNEYGNNVNIEAINFMRRFNETVYHDFPGVMTIAEESSAYPMVTKPTYMGGLGFGFKWNMGWMNDTLFYIKKEPIYRKWHHDKLTFSLMYAFNENFILPFSHDEVVHGKGSMIEKQPGDIWRKFAGLRNLYAYTLAHPGKKLNFMGIEFGQFVEWRDGQQLDWFLFNYDRHPQLFDCVKDLNHIYKSTPALYQIEDSWDGFEWIVPNDSDNSVFAFLRMPKKGKSILCVSNFTPQYIERYRIGLPFKGNIEELINTDNLAYGGSGRLNIDKLNIENIPCNGQPYSVEIQIPPLATVYFTCNKARGVKKPGKEE